MGAPENRTPIQKFRSYTRRSGVIAPLLFVPTRRRRSQKPNFLEESSSSRGACRKSKVEARTSTVNIFAGDSAAVRFNDRTHNAEAHSQPFRFRCEEVIEKSLARLFGNTCAVIAHAHANHSVAIALRRDHHLAAAKRGVTHRIKSIDHEIDQDLL